MQAKVHSYFINILQPCAHLDRFFSAVKYGKRLQAAQAYESEADELAMLACVAHRMIDARRCCDRPLTSRQATKS
eukprot:221475-Chlamydomonas_euryale.AAC.13